MFDGRNRYDAQGSSNDAPDGDQDSADISAWFDGTDTPTLRLLEIKVHNTNHRTWGLCHPLSIHYKSMRRHVMAEDVHQYVIQKMFLK